jgi:LysR family transcriptional regulator, nod-box dependent transcriptional activator
MRFNKLDLNLLVALDALMTLRSVSRAAEQLSMSQSAMSNALARLRDHFDDELLVQVGRNMELTPRAEGLQDAVRDVLVRVDTTIRAKPEFDPTRSDRVFRIFISDYTMVTLMPHLLALAANVSHSVRFEFLPQQNQPQRLLDRGEADLLVIPEIYCSQDHPTDKLLDETFCCIVWRDGPLAAPERSPRGKMHVDAYRSAGHVVFQPPGAAPSFEGSTMQKKGIVRRVEVSTFSFVGALSLVVGTNRVATVHRRLAHHGQKFLPIKLLEPPIPLPTMTQVMQWHKYRTNDPGLVWLRALLHQAVARMDAEASIEPAS